jgi:hypothetical protein
MWTRFNYFVTIEVAIAVAIVGLFKDSPLEWSAVVLAGVAALLGLVWYGIGAEDRYLVETYRGQIEHTAKQLGREREPDWAYVGAAIDRTCKVAGRPDSDWLQWRSREFSTTRLPAAIPLLVAVLWVAVAIAMAGVISTR